MRLGLSVRKNRCLRCIKIFLTLFFLIFSFFSFMLIFFKLEPIFSEYSKIYSENLAGSIVNSAVKELFSQSEYSSFTKTTDKFSDNIQAIETDTAKINKLRTEIVSIIQTNIDEQNRKTIYVPIGSSTGIYFLANIGPKIPITIYPVGIADAEIKSDFSSVGINQTKHELYLEVSMNIHLVGVWRLKEEVVKTRVLLSETVIVGDTPEYYGSNGIGLKLEKQNK